MKSKKQEEASSGYGSSELDHSVQHRPSVVRLINVYTRTNGGTASLGAYFTTINRVQDLVNGVSGGDLKVQLTTAVVKQDSRGGGKKRFCLFDSSKKGETSIDLTSKENFPVENLQKNEELKYGGAID